MSRTLAHAIVHARHLALLALMALVAVAAAGPDAGGPASSGPASSDHHDHDDDDDDDEEQSDAGPDAGEGVADAGADGGPAQDPPSDDDAVGALVDDGQRAFCTGALLSPDIILTAAHCVAQDGVVRWPWGFFLGVDITLGGQFVRVLDGAVHPAYDPFLHTADLAVLRIAGGPPRKAALPIDTDMPDVGVPVRIFGFGSDAVGPTRRDAEVTSQTEDWFRYEPGTCPGDSGGPVVVGDDVALVAGVVSTGSAGCGSARAVAVAPHAEWIREAMEFLDPAACRAGDGACGADCPLGDPDCACIDDDGACRMCAGSDLDCSGSCDTDGRCVTACLAPDPDCRTVHEGAACERDVECASSICFDGTCREPCAAGAGCLPWAACLPRAGDGGDGVCIPYDDAQVLGGCTAAPDGAGAPLLVLLAAVTARRRRSAHPRRRHRQGE